MIKATAAVARQDRFELPLGSAGHMCHGCKTITIVDDDEALLSALRFSFEVEGYPVRTYLSGEALLADPQEPACGCLVVDYKLSGMDGLELLDRLKRRGSTEPAVLITTPPASVARRAAEAQVPMVEKPLLTDALFDKVRLLLAERGCGRVGVA